MRYSQPNGLFYLPFIEKITHIHTNSNVDKYSGCPTTISTPTRIQKDNRVETAFIIYQLIWEQSIRYQ